MDHPRRRIRFLTERMERAARRTSSTGRPYQRKDEIVKRAGATYDNIKDQIIPKQKQ